MLKEDPGEAEDHRHEHGQDQSDEEPEVGAMFTSDRGKAVVHFLFEPVDAPLIPKDPHAPMEAPVWSENKRRYRGF
jgi:hypothetical protein